MKNNTSYPVAKQLGIIFVCSMMYVWTPLARANDLYVAQTAQGLGDGSSAANAKALASLSWSTVNPGDVVHLCGTITNSITFNKNGVTVYFEPDAKISMPTVSELGSLLSVRGNGNIIDGGANGIMECTDNGTELDYSNAFDGIYARSATNTVIKNVHFNDLYVHTSTNDAHTDLLQVGVIDARGWQGSNYIYNCSFSNDCWCIWGGGCALESVSNCMFVNCDHGVAPDAINISIIHCDFGSTSNWDTAANDYHHDGIHYYANPPTATNFIISGNIFHGDWGNNPTAQIFLQSGPDDVLIANNIFLGWPNNKISNGFLYAGGNSNLICNNSFIGADVTNSQALGVGQGNFFVDYQNGGNGTIVENNLFMGVTTFALNYSTNYVETFNRNVYANEAPGGSPPFELVKPVTHYSYSQWQAIYGDVNSFYTNAVEANADGTLLTNSVAIGAGTNQIAYAIANNHSCLTNDFADNPRFAIGPWTIGAYEVTSALPFVSLVASPSNVTNGQSTILTWSSVNVTNVMLNGIIPVPLSGSTNISPQETTTYTVTATGSNGISSASIFVVVALPPLSAPTGLEVIP